MRYVGSTSNLPHCLIQHRSGEGSRFTGRYDVHHLVWSERYERIADAHHREWRLETWKRPRKIELIVERDPH